MSEMPKHIRHRCLQSRLSPLVCLAICMSTTSGNSQTRKTRVIPDEVFTAWAKREQDTCAWKVVLKSTSLNQIDSQAQKVRESESISRRSASGIRLHDWSSTDLRTQERIRVVFSATTQYAFMLQEVQNKGLVLKEFDENLADGVSFQPDSLTTVLGATCPEYVLFEKEWLPNLVNDSAFKIVAFRQQGAVRTIEFDWMNGHGNAKQRTQGEINLDASNDYSISSYRTITETNEATIQSIATFRYSPIGPVFRPTSVEWKELFKYKKTGRSRVYTRDYQYSYENLPLAEEDCALSAFGFPEPQGSTLKRRVPHYIWIFIAASTCCLIAFLFYRLAKRRRATLLPLTIN